MEKHGFFCSLVPMIKHLKQYEHLKPATWVLSNLFGTLLSCLSSHSPYLNRIEVSSQHLPLFRGPPQAVPE